MREPAAMVAHALRGNRVIGCTSFCGISSEAWQCQWQRHVSIFWVWVMLVEAIEEIAMSSKSVYLSHLPSFRSVCCYLRAAAMMFGYSGNLLNLGV
jgi:hypothetical protein